MSWIRMLKGFTKTRTRCPVVVYEDINAVFGNKKTQKRTKKTKNFPKITKVSKFSIFQSFFAFFVDWNVLRGQQGKRWLSSKSIFKSLLPFSK